MNNLVTIIISIFNNQTNLHQHLQSIINQSYKNIEVLIIDSYSTDSSMLIAKQYAELDSRIQILQGFFENDVQAYTYGIQKAKGKYIYCSSPLTILSLNYLEYSLSQIKNYDIFTCQCKTLSEEKIRHDYPIKIPQPPEKNQLYEKGEYINSLYKENYMNFETIFLLYNKIILKEIIDSNFQNQNPLFFYKNLLTNASQILETNQTLIIKFDIDKYLNDICFNNNELNQINFLEDLLLENKKDLSKQLVLLTLLLSEILKTRQKLFFPYLELNEKETLISTVDAKFKSLYKYCKEKQITSAEIEEFFEKYIKILKKEKAIKASPYLYL